MLKLQDVKENGKLEKARSEAAQSLSRVPGNCPVGKCTEVIFPCNMMLHMLHKHVRTVGHNNAEVFENQPLAICFDPTELDFSGNHCVATLMYGGAKDEPDALPGLCNLSMPNTVLRNAHARLEHHLPIMLLVCRSTWYALLEDKQLERQLIAMNALHSGIYVFWLVAPVTTRQLYYSLTVYNRHYLNSRSVMRVVRNYTHSQNPSEFLPYEDNCLVLRDSEVNEFLHTSSCLDSKLSGKCVKHGITMELSIHEHPKQTKVKHCSQKELHDALQQLQDVEAIGMPGMSSIMSLQANSKPKPSK